MNDISKPENYPDGDYDYEDVCQWQEQAIVEKDKIIDRKQAEIDDYKSDREYFRNRDAEQCKEISRNHVKIKKQQA